MKIKEEQEQREKVKQFHIGLNDSYAAIRGWIIFMQPIPLVRRVYSMIIQEEKRGELVVSKEVMIADTQGKKNNFFCNNTETDQRNNRIAATAIETTTLSKCFHLHGFQRGHKFHKKNE